MWLRELGVWWSYWHERRPFAHAAHAAVCCQWHIQRRSLGDFHSQGAASKEIFNTYQLWRGKTKTMIANLGACIMNTHNASQTSIILEYSSSWHSPRNCRSRSRTRQKQVQKVLRNQTLEQSHARQNEIRGDRISAMSKQDKEIIHCPCLSWQC